MCFKHLQRFNFQKPNLANFIRNLLPKSQKYAMNPLLIELCGWLPAIIIPLATIIQLSAILRNRSTSGVSGITWFLFGVANVGLYIYTEKYGDPQAIAGLLGSALLDFVITGLAITQYGANHQENSMLDEKIKVNSTTST